MTRPDRTVAARVAALAIAVSIAASAPAPVLAAEPALIIHYNERPPQHFTLDGIPKGPAMDKVSAALTTARIPYALRSTPAKQQLVLLRANAAPACMLAWVALPGRERDGKFSDVIYRDEPRGSERRLWCTKATPDEWLQRLNAALSK